MNFLKIENPSEFIKKLPLLFFYLYDFRGHSSENGFFQILMSHIFYKRFFLLSSYALAIKYVTFYSRE